MEFNRRYVQEPPPPGVFPEQYLGPIMITLRSFHDDQGSGDGILLIVVEEIEPPAPQTFLTGAGFLVKSFVLFFWVRAPLLEYLGK